MTIEGLSETERATIRQALTAERARLTRGLAGLDRTFEELVEAADLEPPDDEHDPDGTTAYERAQVSSLASATRVRLTEIDRALADVERVDFGRCRSCGGPIGLERLLAVAGTDRCVRCAATGSG